MFYLQDDINIHMIEVKRLSWQSGFFSIPARNHSALAFRVSGRGHYTCGDKKFTANGGNILFMPQGRSYDVDYSPNEIVVFHFVLNDNCGEPENYNISNSDELYKLFLKAELTWSQRAPGYKQRTVSLFYEILARLCESDPSQNLPSPLLNALSVINSRFTDCELNISDICGNAGLCETALRSLFKKHFGKTPVGYITELRIERAKVLIASGETVENAALASGFNDPKYFSRVVKKISGHTPREFTNYGK